MRRLTCERFGRFEPRNTMQQNEATPAFSQAKSALQHRKCAQNADSGFSREKRAIASNLTAAHLVQLDIDETRQSPGGVHA
jgi:predicted cobalt transporter CbtA